MKKIITLCLLALSTLTFAQEAGKKGELLKNEASVTEMKKPQAVNQNRQTTARQSTGKPIQSHTNQNGRPRYNWYQNNSYAEVFLRIPEYGYFTVEIDDQAISSASGKYRFFDLQSGRMMLSIYQDGYLVYRTPLNVRNNTRLVLDYFSNKGLFLLDSYRVQGQMYGVNEWDDVWNNPYNNQPNYNNQPGYNHQNNVMDNRSFNNFVETLKKTATFDNDKLAFIQQQVPTAMFTAQQIKILLDTFSFDDTRLKAGKLLYDYCTDTYNFYTVYESFDFDRNRNDLMNYVSKRR